MLLTNFLKKETSLGKKTWQGSKFEALKKVKEKPRYATDRPMYVKLVY